MNKEEDKTSNKGNRKRFAWSRIFARTGRVSARMTKEREWHTDVPNIKLSRAFVIVLIIHVVAVGGILAFEMFKPNADVAKAAAASRGGEPMTDLERSAQAVGNSGEKARSEIHDGGFDKHIVQSGDSLSVIAARHGVSRDDITRINMIDSNHPLIQGRVLRIPKRGTVLPEGEKMVNAKKPDTIPVAHNGSEAAVSPMPVEDVSSIKLDEKVTDYQPTKDFPLLGSDAMKSAVSEAEKNGEAKKAEDAKQDAHADWLKGPNLETKIVSPGPLVPTAPHRTERPTVHKKIPSAGSSAASTEKKPAAGGRSYKVQSGDTFYAIGRKFGVNYKEILKANGIANPRDLRAGQVLRIP